MKEQLYAMLVDTYNNGSKRVFRTPASGDLREITVDLTGAEVKNPIINPFYRDFSIKYPSSSVCEAAQRIFYDALIYFTPNAITIGNHIVPGAEGQGQHTIKFDGIKLPKIKKLNYDGAIIEVDGRFPEISVISIIPGKQTDLEQFSRYVQFIECINRTADCINGRELDDQALVDWIHETAYADEE